MCSPKNKIKSPSLAFLLAARPPPPPPRALFLRERLTRSLEGTAVQILKLFTQFQNRELCAGVWLSLSFFNCLSLLLLLIFFRSFQLLTLQFSYHFPVLAFFPLLLLAVFINSFSLVVPTKQRKKP